MDRSLAFYRRGELAGWLRKLSLVIMRSQCLNSEMDPVWRGLDLSEGGVGRKLSIVRTPSSDEAVVASFRSTGRKGDLPPKKWGQIHSTSHERESTNPH